MDKLLAGRQLTNQDFYKYNLSQSEIEVLKKDCLIVKAIEKVGRSNLLCVRCGNQTNFQYLGSEEGHYCLNCLKLGRLTEKDVLFRFPPLRTIESNQAFLTWEGKLSSEQERASQAMIASVGNGKIHIIQAVTGAGKTEMIFGTIDAVLKKGGRVAIASPRIDVCLELEPRIKEAFQGTPVITLYGTMVEKYFYTSIVILTTHQLWKFYQAFDLLIVDEIDAFPLSGDLSLHYGIKQAIKPKGKTIYLTATPDQYVYSLIHKNEAEITILPARFHRFPLPVPQFIWIGNWRKQINNKIKGKLIDIIQSFLELEGKKLIFMPDITLAESLLSWLSQMNEDISVEVVHSQDINRTEKVKQLRNGTISTLITTTILERGVTFTNCHVLIIGSEDRAYSSSALIQMSGRVGRKKEYPNGKLYYAHYGISLSMIKARKNILNMNQLAKEKGLLNEKI